MKRKIIIIAQDKPLAEALATVLNNNSYDTIKTFARMEMHIEDIRTESPDILIISFPPNDAHNMIDLYKSIKKVLKVPAIFIIDEEDSLLRDNIIRLRPAAIFTRPFNVANISLAIDVACHQDNYSLNRVKSTYSSFFLKDPTLYKKVEVCDILYVEAKGSYSAIVTNSKTYTLSYNLKQFSRLINHKKLIKVHRSYLVNTQNVDGFDASTIIVKGRVIPVSKKYQPVIAKMFVKV